MTTDHSSSAETENLLSNNGGIPAVLKIALPLLLSCSCHAFNMFVDRLMLARYSQEACAACMTSGLTNFTFACIFTGTLGYTGTFVAQYTGAEHPERVGCSVWQGIFVAMLGSAFLAVCGFFFSEQIFKYFGHDPAVVKQEVAYFRALCYGAWSFMIPNALSCFWSGRGKTAMILIVSIFTSLLNVPFNYILIYGKCGCPEMGVTGAAWGTILSGLSSLLIYGFAFFGWRTNRKLYRTCSGIFDKKLFFQVIRYGLPNGIQLFLDIAAFTVFTILLGRYGVAVQEATSISCGINNISFCPILGIGQTASIMVGQAVGARNINYARKSTRSCFIIMVFYMIFCAIFYCLFPDVLLDPFARKGDPAQVQVMEYSRIMLKIIAAYLIFDGTNIIYTSAVKGAGDTRFIMFLTIIMGWCVFAIPCVILYCLHFSFWWLWGVLDVYVALFAVCSYMRYLSGKWTRMRVIENSVI